MLKLRDRGCIVVKNTVTNMPGFPDLTVIEPGGYTYFIEVKAKGKKPTKRQIMIHKKLKLQGCVVLVIDDLKLV